MAIEVKIGVAENGLGAARVAQIFGVKDTALAQRMQALAEAALEEYELAVSGARAPSTMRELRELRLRLLYKHLPAGEPTDDQIGELFQMTRTQVGTLVAGMRARFGPEVEEQLKREAGAALIDTTRVEDNLARVIVRDSLGRYIQDLAAQALAAPMEKPRESSRTYHVRRSTIEKLCPRLGIDLSEVKGLK
jgi:hypothetical protein